MDAVPITLSQELRGWQAQIDLSIARLRSVTPRLHELAQGGTAVGTGINARPEFGPVFARCLAAGTGLPFRPSDNYFAALSSQDTAVELSGQLKVLSVSLMKIANDLRWMNSGPLAGLGEIALPALQPGSSIMPGKVNAVVPESVTMIAAQVMGTDAPTAASIYDELMPMFSDTGRFDPKALAVLRRSFVEMKTLPTEPDMSKLYTEAFLPK